jgi:hypothetical protein
VTDSAYAGVALERLHHELAERAGGAGDRRHENGGDRIERRDPVEQQADDRRRSCAGAERSP